MILEAVVPTPGRVSLGHNRKSAKARAGSPRLVGIAKLANGPGLLLKGGLLSLFLFHSSLQRPLALYPQWSFHCPQLLEAED
jgi:hypothetical protein